MLDIKTRRITTSDKPVEYSENGSCDVAGKQAHCMYTGFEFDYRNAAPNSWLDCVYKTSQPVHSANIYSREKRQQQSWRYRLFLAQGLNHYLKVGYENKEPGDKGILTTRIKCSYFGHSMLNVHQSVKLN